MLPPGARPYLSSYVDYVADSESNVVSVSSCVLGYNVHVCFHVFDRFEGSGGCLGKDQL